MSKEKGYVLHEGKLNGMCYAVINDIYKRPASLGSGQTKEKK